MNKLEKTLARQCLQTIKETPKDKAKVVAFYDIYNDYIIKRKKENKEYNLRLKNYLKFEYDVWRKNHDT